MFDCSGVSDGAAAAIICRVEDAHNYCANPLYVKALSFVAGPAAGPIDPGYDYTTFPEVVRSAEDAYQQAGITDPRAQLAMAEVHDCFTPTELVLMEDMGFATRGTAWKEVLAGTFDRDGELPVNPDGGLKSFGHPIGASGLRMLFECWLQLRGEAPADRQIATVRRGPDARPDPQPGRSTRGVRELRRHRRQRARRLMSGASGIDLLAEDEDQAALRQLARDVALREVAPRASQGDETGEVPPEVRKALASADLLRITIGEKCGRHGPGRRRGLHRARRDRPGGRVVGHLLPADLQRAAPRDRASRPRGHEGAVAPRRGRRRRVDQHRHHRARRRLGRPEHAGRPHRGRPGTLAPQRLQELLDAGASWPRGCSSGAAGPEARAPRASVRSSSPPIARASRSRAGTRAWASTPPPRPSWPSTPWRSRPTTSCWRAIPSSTACLQGAAVPSQPRAVRQRSRCASGRPRVRSSTPCATCRSGSSAGGRWPTCRACSGSWPIWRCSSRGPACFWAGPCAWPAHGGTPPPLETAMAKTAANLAAKFVCDEAMQIHGGYGYSREYPLERAYRDIRGLCFGAGTVEAQRNFIGLRVAAGGHTGSPGWRNPLEDLR